MTTRDRLLIVGVLVAAILLLGWRVAVWQEAAQTYERSRFEGINVEQRLARAEALRGMPAVAGFGARPTEDVMKSVAKVLEACGIEAGRLRGVQGEMDRPAGSSGEEAGGRRSATARLTLEPMTTQELGAFLGAWRSGQGVWSVSRVELNALPAGNSGRKSGLYRVGITLSSLYFADETVTSSAARTAGDTP